MPAGAAVVTDRLAKRFDGAGRWARLGQRRGRRGAVDALSGVDLVVLPGELVAVTGANGSGKSTLLRLLATLLTPSAGTATVDGHDVAAEALAVRRRIAFVPADDRALSLRLTGRENLGFHAALQGVAHRQAPARVADALARLDLDAVADDPCATYSTGTRQRLNVARALLGDAPVLLLDEPFRGLDAEHAQGLGSLLAGLTAVDGRTVIAATHDTDVLAGVWTQVLRLDRGAVAPAPGGSAQAVGAR